MTDSLMPPRKRNWKEGQLQIGLFVRTPTGSVMEMVTDDVDHADLMKFIEVLKAAHPQKEVQPKRRNQSEQETC